MDKLELKDTTHFLRDFGDIHHGTNPAGGITDSFEKCIGLRGYRKIKGRKPCKHSAHT